MENIIREGSKILDVNIINNFIGEVKIDSASGVDSINRRGNCIIGAYITAIARIHMHTHLSKLVSHGFTPLYEDVDGLIFIGPDDTKTLPVPCGSSFGEFKHELGNDSDILTFHAMSKKNYCIRYNLKGQTSEITKIRGISFHSVFAKKCLSSTEYIKLFEEYQAEIKQKSH